ncbi:MAG TPA: hypothetical protein VE170_14100, partial [Candidatus Limnocylindria bacterium]|nr:hypothetical protein [Candidatus Limnocylindria bacterium]
TTINRRGLWLARLAGIGAEPVGKDGFDVCHSVSGQRLRRWFTIRLVDESFNSSEIVRLEPMSFTVISRNGFVEYGAGAI